MRPTGWRWSRISCWALTGALLFAGVLRVRAQGVGSEGDSGQMQPGGDPPSVVARLSVAQGNVSVEPGSVDQFSPAEVNYPLTTGDRLWTDYDALAELQGPQLAVRMGQATDLTVTAMTDTLAQFGLAQGSVHLRTYALAPETTTELDTPHVAVTVLAPGDVRVDVDANGDATVVTVLSGVVQVDGPGFEQTAGAGQALRLVGANPIAAQWLVMPRQDGLDRFSMDRDQGYERAAAAEQAELNLETIGGADLQQYGSWLPEEEYGAVWFPASVPVGWQPYCYGRWTWVAPWGWTWIDQAQWGFAPFHYGRWAMFSGRWGWIPGPPVVHPVYAPALVVFVHPGNGVSAWFPLGPNEPYAPWYHSSTLYVNRVNVSNLYSRNVNEVRTIYNVTNREVYPDALAGQRRFANRTIATVAVPQANLAGGRPVRGTVVHLPPQQMAAAPVLPHPLVSPERTMLATGSAKALPARVARPALMSHEGQPVREVQLPHVPEPQRAEQAAPEERRGQNAPVAPAQGEPNQIEYRNLPGQKNVPTEQQAGRGGEAPRTDAAPGPVPPNQEGNRSAAQPNVPGAPPKVEPGAPSFRAGTIPPAPTNQAGQQDGMTIKGGVRPPNPARGTEPMPPANTAAPRGTQQRPGAGAPAPRVQMPWNEPQQLYNRSVPPPTRPSFEQQRQAIESTDPGRPLSPQQMDNVRQNRPVGQPQMREPAPHPSMPPPAAQRSAPAQHSQPQSQGRPR